jgi:2OG-Fe(II) oxygenase superfamily
MPGAAGGRVSYQIFDDPFRHAVGAVDEARAARLADAFPRWMLRESSRMAGGGKTYRVRAQSVYDHGRWLVDRGPLGTEWSGFLDECLVPDRITDLAGLLDLPGVPGRIELRLTEYTGGGWMSRHTDRPDKAFSQLVYFSPGWHREWGGELALFGNETARAPARVLYPGGGNVVAFARSERSWHEVRPVRENAEAARRALLIHGYWE